MTGGRRDPISPFSRQKYRVHQAVQFPVADWAGSEAAMRSVSGLPMSGEEEGSNPESGSVRAARFGRRDGVEELLPAALIRASKASPSRRASSRLKPRRSASASQRPLRASTRRRSAAAFAGGCQERAMSKRR